MLQRDGRTLDHKTSEEFRLLAVRRVVEGKEKPAAVARSLGLCRTAVYPWLRAFRKKGVAALKSRKAKGREPKLTADQKQQVKKWIIGRDPRQFSLDFGLWTRNIVAHLIKKKFGVVVGRTAVGRLLAQMGITPQKPLRRAYERDPAAVKEWVEKRYPALRKRAKKHGASIFFLDEAGFSSEPNLGRTYGLKGQTPEIRTSGQRQKVNAISAVNARGGFWSTVYTGMLNGSRFLEFLKAFRKGIRGRVFLVLDGHPAHHAKMVKKYVKDTRGMLELHFLPPYAPDLNPDEFVWQHAKTNGVAKKPLKEGESLRRRVEADLAAMKLDKALVMSFFGAASVVYAKD